MRWDEAEEVVEMAEAIKEQILQVCQSGQDPDNLEDAVKLTAAWLSSRRKDDLLACGRVLYSADVADDVVLLHMAVITGGLEALVEVMKTIKAAGVARPDSSNLSLSPTPSGGDRHHLHGE